MTDAEIVSDTPRTDAHWKSLCSPHNALALARMSFEGDLLAFARQLERELTAERERAERNEKDAKRYGWLADNPQISEREEFGAYYDYRSGTTFYTDKESLDAAIDAAMMGEP